MFTLVRTVSLIFLLSLAALAHDISGKWTFTVETDAGSGSPTFIFKQTGEKLTGTYNGAFGTAEIVGTVVGEKIQFSFEAVVADQKGKVTYTGKIEAEDRMKGEVEFTGMGKGTWTGKKQ